MSNIYKKTKQNKTNELSFYKAVDNQRAMSNIPNIVEDVVTYSTFTPNLGLEKPAQEDFYDIDIHNKNYDIIDEQMKELSNKAEQALQSVSEGKELIATAITDKGVATNKDDTFQQMASNILDIKTGGDKFYLDLYKVAFFSELQGSNIFGHSGYYICSAGKKIEATNQNWYSPTDTIVGDPVINSDGKGYCLLYGYKTDQTYYLQELLPSLNYGYQEFQLGQKIVLSTTPYALHVDKYDNVYIFYRSGATTTIEKYSSTLNLEYKKDINVGGCDLSKIQNDQQSDFIYARGGTEKIVKIDTTDGTFEWGYAPPSGSITDFYVTFGDAIIILTNNIDVRVISKGMREIYSYTIPKQFGRFIYIAGGVTTFVALSTLGFIFYYDNSSSMTIDLYTVPEIQLVKDVGVGDNQLVCNGRIYTYTIMKEES